MLFDPTTSSAQNNARTDRPDVPLRSEGGSRPGGEVRPEAGRTSESSPDVVMHVSAAALQSSRAVTQGSQAADQNRARESVRESEQRDQAAREQREVPPGRERAGGRVDVRI